jgi:PBP1b-binding outer membrane lipoprotein LpoB
MNRSTTWASREAFSVGSISSGVFFFKEEKKKKKNKKQKTKKKQKTLAQTVFCLYLNASQGCLQLKEHVPYVLAGEDRA